MARLSRYFQKIFGINAGSNQMAEYGSFIGAPPGNLYSGSTITPDIVQNLSQFESGQYAAVGGAYSPTIQDHNSLFYLNTYQLSYLMQLGIAEWNAETTYYIGSIVQNGNGVNYVSKTDNNLNNPLSDDTNWRLQIPTPSVTTYITGSGNYTTSSVVAPLYLRVRVVGAGGGGEGSGTSITTGTSGTSSTFGTTLVVGTGGSGGGISGADGGTGSVGIGAQKIFIMDGGKGGSSTGVSTDDAIVRGGSGGSTVFGSTAGSGYDGVANSGTGGAGGGISGASLFSGQGGGGGGYAEAYIFLPGKNISFAYEVGQGGVGGGAGPSGEGGGNGADGMIIIEEYY